MVPWQGAWEGKDKYDLLFFFFFLNILLCCSVTRFCLTLCDPLDCSMPGFPVLHYLRVCSNSWSIESVMPFSHLISYCPLLLLPSIFSSIMVFSSESALCIRWPKYWNFSVSPSSEYSVLISFRIDWFDLLAVQGTLKSSLAPQFESINSLMLSLLYGPSLTSIHDYWKKHGFD